MIYICIVFIIILLIKMSDTYKSRIFSFIALSIAILFLGFRENVGIDYKVDKNIYENLIRTKGILNYFLAIIFKKFDIGFNYIIFFMSFLNILLCNFLLKTKNKKKEGWILYFLDYSYISSFNVMRQSVSNFCFLLGIRQKNIFITILLISIGFGFHKTIIFICPIIFLLKKIYNRKILIYFLGLAIILSLTIDIQQIMINYILPNLGAYGEIYLRKDLIDLVIKKQKMGMGLFFRITLSCLLIYYYDILKKREQKEIIYINASIFWAILSIISYKIFIVSRILEYIYPASLISYPILFKEIKKSKIGKYFVYLVWIIFILIFLKSTFFADSSQKLLPYKSKLFDIIFF